MEARDATVEIDGGRHLAYRDRGPHDGTPVFYLHGCPGSRLDDATGLGAALERHGVRMVAVDRPGFGRSDPHPGRTMSSLAGDVAALAGALGIERFGVYGMSAGGPYALAVAASLPDRVSRVAVAVGVGPWCDGFFEGMGGDEQILYRLSRRAPWLVRLGMAAGRRQAHRDPDKVLEKALSDASASDRALLADPGNRAATVATFLECLTQGGRCVAEDFRLLSAPWDFDAAAIRAPLDLWHGDEDRMVPIAHCERVAELVTHATLHRCAGEGHFLGFARYDEILATLSAAPAAPPRAPPRRADDAA